MKNEDENIEITPKLFARIHLVVVAVYLFFFFSDPSIFPLKEIMPLWIFFLTITALYVADLGEYFQKLKNAFKTKSGRYFLLVLLPSIFLAFYFMIYMIVSEKIMLRLLGFPVFVLVVFINVIVTLKIDDNKTK